MSLVGGTDFVSGDPTEAGLDFSPVDYTAVPNISSDSSGLGNPAGVIASVGTTASQIITAANPPTLQTAGGVRATGSAAVALAGSPGAAINLGIGAGSNALLLLLVISAVLIVALR